MAGPHGTDGAERGQRFVQSGCSRDGVQDRERCPTTALVWCVTQIAQYRKSRWGGQSCLQPSFQAAWDQDVELIRRASGGNPAAARRGRPTFGPPCRSPTSDPPRRVWPNTPTDLPPGADRPADQDADMTDANPPADPGADPAASRADGTRAVTAEFPGVS